MPLIDLKKVVPGYAEAIERQDLVRDVAFLGVPETLCGIEVAPMTFRHLLWLQLVRSPFIGAGLPDAETLHLAVAAFFKTLAPLEKPSFMLTAFDRKLQVDLKRYMESVGKLKASDETLKAINEFVNEAFIDSPGGADGAAESYYSVGAALTHQLCKNYSGLNPNPLIYPGAIDIPLKAGFQMLKLVKQEECSRAGRKCILFNGLSDRAKSRWMNSMNQHTEGN
jgi:hypothetical protein